MIPRRVNILGVGVSAINMKMALDIIDEWIEKGSLHYVCVTNVHLVMESQRDKELRRILNVAGMVTPDGMPLVWLSRFKGFKEVDRIYGPDLMLALSEYSVRKGYRHFFYGGTDESVTRLVANLKKRFNGLEIVGSYAPPFRELTTEEDSQIIATINGTRPDIVWIGLGAPKQERWMAAHRNRLDAPALIGVGAAFDFHAGLKKQAPRWMQRSGLEWFFRLMTEPARLWRRYLINNPLFIWLIFLQMMGIKHYEIE